MCIFKFFRHYKKLFISYIWHRNCLFIRDFFDINYLLHVSRCTTKWWNLFIDRNMTHHLFLWLKFHLSGVGGSAFDLICCYLIYDKIDLNVYIKRSILLFHRLLLSTNARERFYSLLLSSIWKSTIGLKNSNNRLKILTMKKW